MSYIKGPAAIFEAQLGVLMKADFPLAVCQVAGPASVELLRHRDFQDLVRVRWRRLGRLNRKRKVVVPLLTAARPWYQPQNYQGRRDQFSWTTRKESFRPGARTSRLSHS